jgi:hypothetical protein
MKPTCWKTKSRGKVKAPHLLFKVQPSLLIDPYSIDEKKAGLRTACFMGCITIAVAFKYRKAKVRAVVIDANEKWAPQMKTILGNFDIDVMVCDLDSELEDVVNFIDESWSQRFQPRTPVVSLVTNISEAWFKERCDRAIGHVILESDRSNSQKQQFSYTDVRKTPNTFEKKYLIFREPSLNSIVDMTHGGYREAEFAQKSRVDLFVTGPQPDLVPLLAIEIDGQLHLEQKQMAKDKMKNKILMEANIPLVRLALGDLDFRPNTFDNQVVDMAERRRRIQFEQLLEGLLNKLISALDTERIDIPSKFSIDQDAVLSVYMSLVNEYRKTHSTISIPHDVEADLWDEAEGKCKESLYEAQFNAYQHSLMWRDDIGARIYREWFEKTGYEIGDLYSSVDENGYASSVCVISTKQQTNSFTSPKMRLQYFGPDMDKLDLSFRDILHGALVEAACIQAVDYVKQTTRSKSFDLI